MPESQPGAHTQQAADAAAAARLEGSLSTTPGYSQALPALKALDQEGKSRLADLQARHPGGPPPEAVQALHEDLARRSATVLAQAQEKLSAAQSAYAGLKAAMSTRAESEVRPIIATNLAEALHIPAEEADGLIEDMRNLDWNEHITQDRKLKTPEDYAREHEKIQESKSISGFIHALGAGAKELWNGTSDKRQTRLLTNGAIIVNPDITGEKEYQDAIAAATATPEAKAAALDRYPEVRQAAGQNVLDNIQEIADTFGKEYVQDWQDFASQRPKDVSEQEWAMRFAEKLKTDAAASPFVARLKEASRSLAQGTNDAGQQAAGIVGGLTGSEGAMDLAAKLARRSHAYETTKHLDATESHGMLSRAVFSQLPRLVPSLLPASGVAKFVQGGARVLAATKIGQRLLPALGATIQAAATPAQAVKAIETLTRAGLAGAAAVGGAQTYGSQITDIYDTLRREHPELSHEQALHAAQTPAILSGLATAALTTLGGSQGIQRLLTRPAEAKAAITQVFTSHIQKLGHLGGEFAKGALKENIEETADGLISAIAKAVGTGQSVQQAVGDYIQQIPENALITTMLGGGGEAISAAGDSTVRRPVAPTAATPPNLPSAPQQHNAGASVAEPTSQHLLPVSTTKEAGTQPSSDSGKQPSTTVNDPQPSQTSPTPVPTFAETSAASQTIDKLKAQKTPLSPEQQQELGAAEKTVARRTEDNILKQQAAIEKRGGKLHPTTAKALAAAQARLAPDGPAASTAQSSSGPAATTSPGSSSSVGATTSGSATPSQGSPGSSSNAAPRITGTSAAPEVGHGKLIPETTTSTEHVDLARRRVENLEKIAAKRKLDPHEQSVYDNARRVRDRNAPGQPGDRNNPPPTPGSRNTGNPDDLAMSGDEDALVPVTPDGEDATLDASADAPPADIPAPSPAVGTTVQGSSSPADPNAPRASAGGGPGNSGAPATPQQQSPTSPQTPARPDSNGAANAKSAGKSPPANGQPPPHIPAFDEVSAAIQTAEKLKAQKNPRSLEQELQLDAAEKTVAKAKEANILAQQAAIEKQGGKLHPTAAKDLADAQATLARPAPSSTGQSNSKPQNQSKNASPSATDPSGTVLPDGTRRTTPPAKAFDPNNPPPPTPEEIAQAKTELKKGHDQVGHPVTGSQGIRKQMEATQYTESVPVTKRSANKPQILRAPGKPSVFYKPNSGLNPKKLRAGIDPPTMGHREVAASKLAEAIGSSIIPPTTLKAHGGDLGSGQFFQEDMMNGEEAKHSEHKLLINDTTKAPANLPDKLAEEWQLMDDLLMHVDRHPENYMLSFDDKHDVNGAALVDNGLSLPDNPGVVEKPYHGPREGQNISLANKMRLRHLIDNEASVRESLRPHLQEGAVDGLFARAKALLQRGKYGNFTLEEIKDHLPKDYNLHSPVPFNETH